MTNFSNYHTHTCFCDGADSPEELIREALRLGCPELGFSGHSYTPFDLSGGMSPENTRLYRREIRRLQAACAGQLRVLLGLELDFYSAPPEEPYDYLIGSVHYVRKDGVCLCVDDGVPKLTQAVREHFGGDIYALIEAYYETVSRLYDRTGCDIIGHFDLITKYNEGGALFDENHPRYRRAALAALDRLCESPAVFELNTGPVVQGLRSVPYPAPFLVEALRKRGKKLLLSSDCHRKDALLFAFEQAAARYGEETFLRTLPKGKREIGAVKKEPQ